MSETNKNKSPSKEDHTPIKIAFQANIFRYIQKKKQQSTLFKAILKDVTIKTPTSSNQQSVPETSRSKKIQSNSPEPEISNLIPPLMATKSKLLPRPGYFEHQENSEKSKGMVNVQSEKKESMVVETEKPVDGKSPQKKNRHKYALSDWRQMYEGRSELSDKMYEFANRKKMSVTDRLFYPRVDNEQPVTCKKFSIQQANHKKTAHSYKKRSSSSFQPSNTISSFNFYKKLPDSHLSKTTHSSNCKLSDENLLHLYHCSQNNLQDNPQSNSTTQMVQNPSSILKKYPSAKKLFVNFNKNNVNHDLILKKQSKNQQSKIVMKQGLRQMNEGLLQDGKVFNDLGFRTYHNDGQQKSHWKKLLQQEEQNSLRQNEERASIKKWETIQSCQNVSDISVGKTSQNKSQVMAEVKNNDDNRIPDGIQQPSKETKIISSLVPQSNRVQRRMSQTQESKMIEKFKAHQNKVERAIYKPGGVSVLSNPKTKAKNFRSTLYESSFSKYSRND